MSARRHRNVNACVAQAITMKNAVSSPAADDATSLKERRAAARRRNLVRQQPIQHVSHQHAPEQDGSGAEDDESAALAWESKRQRSQSTRPRRNVGLAAIRSARCVSIGFLMFVVHGDMPIHTLSFFCGIMYLYMLPHLNCMKQPLFAAALLCMSIVMTMTTVPRVMLTVSLRQQQPLQRWLVDHGSIPQHLHHQYAWLHIVCCGLNPQVLMTMAVFFPTKMHYAVPQPSGQPVSHPGTVRTC